MKIVGILFGNLLLASALAFAPTTTFPSRISARAGAAKSACLMVAPSFRLVARRSLFEPFPSCLFPRTIRPMYSHELLLDVQSSAADKNAEMMLKLSLNQMESIKGREGLQGKDADRAMSAVKLAAGGKLEEEVSVCTSESMRGTFFQ
jgi:hypothetical protein